MGNRFMIFVALVATVDQVALASSAVGGINSSSDIQVAYKRTLESWTRSIEILFDSIEGNLSGDDARNEFVRLLVNGYDYIFSIVPSYVPNETLRQQLVSDFNTFGDIVYGAVDFAKSKNGTFLDILTEINAIHASLNFQPVTSIVFQLCRFLSLTLWTEVIADLQILYINAFAAMVSRAALDFGFINEIPRSLRDGGIAETVAVAENYYNFIQNDPNHFCVSDVIASVISNTSGRTPLKYFPRSFQQYIHSYCWPYQLPT